MRDNLLGLTTNNSRESRCPLDCLSLVITPFNSRKPTDLATFPGLALCTLRVQ